MRTAPVILAIGLITGTVTAADSPRRNDAESVARATAGLRAGRPQTCLPPRLNSGLRADGSMLIYRVSRSLVYVNNTTGGCERVGYGDYLVTVSPIGRICSGDIARTVDQVSGFTTGSCALGEFTPYTKSGS